MRIKTIYQIIFSILTVVTLTFIFGNSAADGGTSGQLSLRVLRWVNGVFDSLSLPVELTHFAVRKLAHFAEYSALGALLTVTARVWRRQPWRFGAVWIPLVCGLSVAALDELLQTFVPGRSGSIADTALDFCGVLWASLVVAALFVARRKTSAQREQAVLRRRSSRRRA